MRFLLDTHVVLWLLLGERQRIPEPVEDALADLDNVVLLSGASIWEIAVKRSIGKLGLEDRWLAATNRLGFEATPITAEHAATVETLPLLHRDPFDRLLLAQAMVERSTLVTADPRMSAYDVPTLWA